ncbi:Gfo/Idh/MocA family protein [Candidatus Neomarinimicrobiota bacterium]
MTSKLKIGVIGVGHLGQHHAKHYHLMSDVNLIGVFDLNQRRANEIAKTYNSRSYSDLSKLIETCDALSIVTPTKFHAEVAKQCFAAKKHVFVEKPITKTVAEADELIELASQVGVTLQVGHIERLNPALLPLNDIDLNPKFIEVQRLAPYTTRGTDVPVVLDLMIHDIDIILALVQSPVKNIHATGVSILTQSVDIANARIRFENGTVANITSSRIAKNKVRKIKVFQRDMYITIDFLLGLTEVYRIIDFNHKNSKPLVSAPYEQNGQQREIVYEKPALQQIDALHMELKNFVDSINGKATPIVDGKAGRDALSVAIKIQNMIIEDIH